MSGRVFERRIDPETVNCGRQGDRVFVAALCEELAEVGELTDEVVIAAVKRAWAPRRTVPTETENRLALQKGKQKLQMDRIGAAIAEVYGIAASFTLDDALLLHVRHIKGELTKEQMTPAGEIVSIQIPPSYAALKDYLKMVLPAAPKQVQIDQRTIVARMSFDGVQPAIEPLPIGEDA